VSRAPPHETRPLQQAEYIGVSRETLRQLELRGEGPIMNPDGSYNYDRLDLFKETPIAA
jgi:hypothetical protein